jgi:Helicase HerA, central domain
MGTLHTISAPPPALYATGDRASVANAYFAVTVDAAVDLLEAREYKDLPRAERVAKAQAEQQGFLNGFFDPGLGVALDLRIAADPAASTPISVALLGRVWGSSVDRVTARAEGLRTQVHAAMPRHVTATAVEDTDTVTRLLSPFAEATVDSAVITRHELIGLPSRPDAGVSYYYSAVPFNWSDNDWSAVYSALAASPVPVVLSVAVLPMQVPPQFAQTLLTLATYYGRLAREGETPGGLYHGKQRLAPDAFAVDAEKTFHDFSRRLSQKAFGLRIQVSAAKQLPPGIVETIAGAIFPAERGGRFLEHQGAASAYDVRRPASVAERRLAEYNLNVINFGMLTGRPEIWSRQDPPDPQLAMLSVIGDARDACRAFRFPIAADGIVPGFRVRRGQLGQAESGLEEGKVIRLGRVSGTSKDITVPLRSLTRPALIAGSTGSGKTTTALEILRQLWADHEIPFLVIEPVNSDDYRKLADEPGFEALEVITVGDEGGAPLRFNPFEVPTGVLVGEHTANLLACFKVAFGLFEPLPSIYQDALNLTYLRAGFLSAERPTGIKRSWPTVVEFLAAMAEVTNGLGYAGDVKASIDAASIRRAQQLVRGITGSAFMTDRPNDIGRLLDHPVILELKSLGTGDEQALMMALLLIAIAEHYQSVRGASADLVHVTLVEEAHRLLARSAGGKSAEDTQAKEKAAEAFAGTLAENRRYGAGVIITEQLPAKLVADAVKNTNLKIMHRLTAEDDRRYLGETMGMDEAQRLLAARLRTGEALLYSDELAEAAQVSIVRTMRAAAPRPGVVQPAAAPPFAACDRCRAQCAYRGAALSMVNDPGIVKGITDAAGPLAHADVTQAERRAGLAGLRGGLYATVGRFAALPTGEPGRSDAAFCLFLHVYASSSLRGLPAWPAIAARLLELADAGETRGDSAPPAAGDGAGPAAGRLGAAGDSLLQAAGDIAGQVERAGGDAVAAAEGRAGEGTDRDPATAERPARDREGR